MWGIIVLGYTTEGIILIFKYRLIEFGIIYEDLNHYLKIFYLAILLSILKMKKII
jgi:hypothetical protein